jgi:hypothetical protein
MQERGGRQACRSLITAFGVGRFWRAWNKRRNQTSSSSTAYQMTNGTARRTSFRKDPGARGSPTFTTEPMAGNLATARVASPTASRRRKIQRSSRCCSSQRTCWRRSARKSACRRTLRATDARYRLRRWERARARSKTASMSASEASRRSPAWIFSHVAQACARCHCSARVSSSVSSISRIRSLTRTRIAVDSFRPRRFASAATVPRSGEGSATLTGPRAVVALETACFLRAGLRFTIVKSTICSVIGASGGMNCGLPVEGRWHASPIADSRWPIGANRCLPHTIPQIPSISPAAWR